MMGTINRKIYFYQIVWVNDDDEKVQKSADFIQEILGAISSQLVGNLEKLSGQSGVTDDLLYLERHRSAKYHGTSHRNVSKYLLSKIRSKDLPLVFDMKNVRTSALNLSNYQGLFEPSHFVIFDGKIIGAEYNHNGLRHINSKLMRLINNYLQGNKVSNISKVEIKPILRTNLYNRINKFEEIRNIEISIAANYAKLLCREDPASFEQMFSAAELVDDMRLTLTFALGRGKRSGDPSMFEKVLNSIKKILSRDDCKDNVSVLNVRGKLPESDSIESFNILEELMLTEKRVSRLEDRTRAINSESMYTEIIKSYFSLEDELREFIAPPKLQDG